MLCLGSILCELRMEPLNHTEAILQIFDVSFCTGRIFFPRNVYFSYQFKPLPTNGYVRVNEVSFIPFNDWVTYDRDTVSYATLRINSISTPKLAEARNDMSARSLGLPVRFTKNPFCSSVILCSSGYLFINTLPLSKDFSVSSSVKKKSIISMLYDTKYVSG